MTENVLDLLKKPHPRDDDRNTDLHYAAANGNVNAVFDELSVGQNIDAGNYLGWTPLMMAVRKGHCEVAKVLLNHRADATRKNHFGVSTFLMAVAHGKLELIYLVLQHLLHGGVSRMRLESVLSPLSLTILFRRNCVLTYLLNQLFNVNGTTSRTGITPLMFAAALDNVKAQKLLLQKGADPSQKNVNGLTANDIVCMKRQKNQTQPSTTCIPSMVLIAPQPAFLNVSPLEQATFRQRKSTDVTTPQCFYTPHLTPIALAPQIFFPSNFSPSQFPNPVASPQPYVLQPSQIGSDKFLPSPNTDFYSPCLNYRIMEDSSCSNFYSYVTDTTSMQYN